MNQQNHHYLISWRRYCKPCLTKIYNHSWTYERLNKETAKKEKENSCIREKENEYFHL